MQKLSYFLTQTVRFKTFYIAITLFACTFNFGAFSQKDSDSEEITINRVHEEIRYESVLDYELDFDQIKQFLTTKQLYDCHLALATNFKEKYDYSRALMHALEALNFAEKLNDVSKQGEIHLKLTNIYLEIQNPEEAIKSAESAVDIFLELKDSFALFDAYNSLANSYLSKGEFPSGLKWYTKSLEITRLLDEDEMAMIPIGNIGAYYLFTGQPDSAMGYIDQALEFDRYNRNRANLAMAYGNKAYAYTLKSEYQLAEAYFDSSFTIAKHEDLRVVLLNLYKDRSDMYFAMGNYKQSYVDLVHYQRINDSLKNSVSSEEIADWKVAFANEEKKRELIKEHAEFAALQHEQEMKTQLNWFITTVLALIILVISALFWRYRTKSRKMKEIIQKDMQLEELTSKLSQQEIKMVINLRRENA